MSTRSSASVRLAPGGPGRIRRHLGFPGGRAWSGRDGDSSLAPSARIELVLALTTVVAMSTVVRGEALWAVAILLVAGTIAGSLQLLAAADASRGGHGVPIETLLLPAVAAIGSLGTIRLVPLGPLVVPALVAIAILVERCLAIEMRMAATAEDGTSEDQPRALIAILVVAFVAFSGIAAIVPNGLAGVGPDGGPIPPLPIGDLALLTAADAVVAGLLGYRAAALRSANARDALWAAATSAIAVGLGAAALRAMGIPRLIGPALLMLLFFLWDSLHAAPSARRRDPRWIWETIALAGLGAIVAFWNLRLIG